MVNQINPMSFLKSAQRKLCLAIGLLAFCAQAASAQTGAITAAQTAQTLEPEKPLARDLAGGQSHSYQITLNAGDYLSVAVEQRDIDVVVEVFGPDGKQIASNVRRSQGQVTVSQVAEATGSYRLEVKAGQQGAVGRYEIRVVGLRVATEKERVLQEADRLGAELFKLYQASKYAEAQPMAKRVVELREKALGPEHPDVAQSLNQLGVFYKENGEYAKAEPPYKRALEILEKTLGPKHPYVIIALNNLAVLYNDMGEYARAVAKSFLPQFA